MGKGKIRNQKPCPKCGANKKYKNCCYKNEEAVPEKVIQYFQKKQRDKEKMKSMGININYVNPIEFKGGKVWALGNRVYPHRHVNQTFHEFLIQTLKEELGKDWWIGEIKKQERHFIIKCFLAYQAWRQKSSKDPKNKINDKVWHAHPDGWTKYLISLAFDVCSLIHAKGLPEHLLRRLRNKDQYQGARHEIAVAAIFARLGYEIEFLDDQEMKSKKHDFNVTDEKGIIIAAVEAKSRHRPGVINQSGNSDEKKNLKGDVSRLMSRALTQNPGDKPFFIFVDLNSPLTPETDMPDKDWFSKIVRSFSRLGDITADNPDPVNAVFFTNYSYHYQAQQDYHPAEALISIPKFCKFPIKDEKFMNMLINAVSKYGYIPNIEIDEIE